MKLAFLTIFLGLSGILNAQTINIGDLFIGPGAIMSTVGAMDNKSTGNLFNDGELVLYSHYNNDGLVTFSSNSHTGKTRMIGSKGYQKISGSMPMQWYDAEFKNTISESAFQLSTEVTIGGTSDFQNGIIDADSYDGKLIFENNGNHINSSDKSFVDGKVSKIGTNRFEYPLGDGGYYRPSLQGNSNLSSDIYTSHYFFKNSNFLYPHSIKEDNIKLIDDQEYWEITKENGTTNIILTLTLNKETTPSFIYEELPNSTIQIVRWDKSNQKWIVEGGIADVDQTMVTAQVSGYGVFTLARVSKPIVEKDNDLIIYNAVSMNGDGKNDFFHIKGIEKYPDNSVQIYNRWGVMVYETKGYNESDKVFNGFSDGRVTVSRGEGLPTGTYYYILKYNNGKNIKEKAGYLYINQSN